ncbi:hypothetical protein ACOME3_001956 [Neoechinorhynchus agilis]
MTTSAFEDGGYEYWSSPTRHNLIIDDQLITCGVYELHHGVNLEQGGLKSRGRRAIDASNGEFSEVDSQRSYEMDCDEFYIEVLKRACDR